MSLRACGRSENGVAATRAERPTARCRWPSIGQNAVGVGDQYLSDSQVTPVPTHVYLRFSPVWTLLSVRVPATAWRGRQAPPPSRTDQCTMSLAFYDRCRHLAPPFTPASRCILRKFGPSLSAPPAPSQNRCPESRRAASALPPLRRAPDAERWPISAGASSSSAVGGPPQQALRHTSQ